MWLFVVFFFCFVCCYFLFVFVSLFCNLISDLPRVQLKEKGPEDARLAVWIKPIVNSPCSHFLVRTAKYA